MRRLDENYIADPVALAPRKALGFGLVVKRHRRAPQHFHRHVPECVDVDDCVEPAIDATCRHRYDTADRTDVKLRSLRAEFVIRYVLPLALRNTQHATGASRPDATVARAERTRAG